MAKYAVSVCIYSYVEVEADSIDGANKAAQQLGFSNQPIKLLNPEVGEVFDDGDLEQTVPIQNWDGEDIHGHINSLNEDAEMWAEAVSRNEADMDFAISRLRISGYTNEDAMTILMELIGEEIIP